jgi:hypothetical protein
VFKDIQVTLYDIFGYLLPGSVVGLAMVLGFWSIFWPSSPFVIPLKLPAVVVTFLLLAAYLSGHLAQAMSNIVERWSDASKRFDEKIPLSSDLEKLLRASAGKHLGAAASNLDAKELYLLCDQSLVHNCSMGERDIFIYREGFYRGNSVALAFLTIVLCVRILHSPATVVIGQRVAELHRNHVAFAAAFTALGAWLAYRRYLRFRKHKFQTCFARFISLWTPSPSTERNKDASA